MNQDANTLGIAFLCGTLVSAILVFLWWAEPAKTKAASTRGFQYGTPVGIVVSVLLVVLFTHPQTQAGTGRMLMSAGMLLALASTAVFLWLHRLSLLWIAGAVLAVALFARAVVLVYQALPF